MKIYTGRRDKKGTAVVRVIEHGDSRRLARRGDLANHSPTGFNWGYGGSGPSQLALAILADALESDQVALRLHQKFKFHVIAALPRDAPWKMTQKWIIDAALRMELGRFAQFNK